MISYYHKESEKNRCILVVLYNDARSPGRIRFTVGHELGHIILGHVQPGSVTIANRDPSPNDDPHETAANQVAARLLAPACVLWGLDLHTPEEIAKCAKKAISMKK